VVNTLKLPADHHSGPHRITDKLFSNTRYFVMKSNNFENIGIAKDKVSTIKNARDMMSTN
jgi:hypothetical protein